MQNVNQIIKTLSLAGSSNREETIYNIIEDVLYNNSTNTLVFNDLEKRIKALFNIEIHSIEIQSAIELLKAKKYISINENKISLTTERLETIERLRSKIELNRNQRYLQFIDILEEMFPNKLSKLQQDKIYEVFTDYLYECFYQFGENAIKIFKSDIVNNIEYSTDRILKDKLQEVETDLIPFVTEVVKEFPNRASVEILDFLESLTHRVDAFFSLGLPKEVHEEINNLNILDWTIFVDTNFLYSILGLHSHTENKVSVDLVELIRKNSSKINLKYIPATLRELKEKKDDLVNSISKVELTTNQIKALLASNKLDTFQTAYYEKKLISPSTPHPANVIHHVNDILGGRGLEFYNSDFKHLLSPEEYLNIKCADFEEFQKFMNDVRVEKGYKSKPIKDYHLAFHDIFLREAILSLRPSKNKRLSEVKYFGLTLDKTLLKFDKNEVGKKASQYYVPTFFAPAILIHKLLRFFPIETTDYKRAFISAISSPVFNLDVDKRKSILAQQSVEYFKELGINDEQAMISCITDDLFLDNIEKFGGTDNLKPFIESEIQKRLDGLVIQVNMLAEKMDLASLLLEQEKQEKNSLENTLTRVTNKLEVVSSDLEVHKRELVKLSGSKIQPVSVVKQMSIEESIDMNKEKSETDILQKKIVEKNNIIVNGLLKKWQYIHLKYLLAFSIPIFFTALYVFFIHAWSLNNVTNEIKQYKNQEEFLWKFICGIAAILMGLIDAFFVKEIIKRFNNHEYIDSKKKLILESLDN